MAKILLYISCPACADEGYNSLKTYWKHTKCGVGCLYLNEYANIHCSGCNHESHLSNWAFKCPEGRHDFRVPTTDGFARVLSTSSQMTSEAGQRWLISVLERLN
jgi:hypothetical protein